MPEGRCRTGVFLLAVMFAAAAFASSGCGTRITSLYEKVLGSKRYERTTEAFTRKREVHDGLEVRFILSSTWLSPEWIRAFSEEYANIYYLDAERKEQMINRWKRESEMYERFFVALFTPDDRTNDGGRGGFRAGVHKENILATRGGDPLLSLLGDLVPGIRSGVSEGGGGEGRRGDRRTPFQARPFRGPGTGRAGLELAGAC